MKKDPTADNPPPLTRAQLAQLLGEWKGYELGTFGRRPHEGDAPEEVWLELRPSPGQAKVCSGCLQPVDAVHDTGERWVRDLPLLGTPVVSWFTGAAWPAHAAVPRSSTWTGWGATRG